MPSGDISIVIADDHAIVREGIRALVEAQRGFRVLGEAADAQEAWSMACELKPNVLLLDLSMPGGGTDAAERISRDCPQVKILALTMHEERGYLTRLLRAGASGYLLKRSASAELVRAIRAVATGAEYVDPSLAGSLLSESAHRNSRTSATSPAELLPGLTVREAEVLKLLAFGHTNKEIGGSLQISVKTVETHRANAMDKLGLRSRVELVRFAMDQGWLKR